jgi:branched-chain amino acid transport system permease protein
VAALLAIGGTIVVAIALERLAIRPVRFPSEMTYMMITIALASIIKGLVLLTWGSETRGIRAFVDTKPLFIFGASLTPQVICVLALLVAVTVGLSCFFNLTLFGKALRASAINPTAANLVGIDSSRFRLFCFGLAGGLGALTGIVTAPITFTGYEIGALTGLKGLVAAIVGQWSITGTVAAGLALGLLEGFAAGFISPGLKDVIALLIMMLFLIFTTVSLPSLRRK